MGADLNNDPVEPTTASGHSSRPNLSGFAEHLRLIHFTLIVACLIAIVAATSQSPSSASRAYDQTNQVLSIQERWKAGEWLENALIEHQRTIVQKMQISEAKKADFVEWIRNPKATQYIALRAEFILRGKPAYYIMNIRPMWRLAAARPRDTWAESVGRSLAPSNRWFEDNASVSDDDWEAVIPRMENLNNAKFVWNSLYRYNHLVLPKGFEISDATGWAISSREEPAVLKQHPEILPEDVAAQAIPLRVQRPPLLLPRAEVIKILSDPSLRREGASKQYEIALRLIKGDNANCYLIARYFRLLILRVDCVGESVSLQSKLINELPPLPSLGDFPRSFPDLDELGKNLSSLDISDLGAVFLAERNRASEKIEVLGAKLPSETAANWSIMIILAVAVYLYVTFRDFARRVTPDDKAWDVPWIGTSSDPVSQAAFFVTMAILPGTIAFISWKNLSAGRCIANGAYIVAVGIAIAISTGVIASCRASMRVEGPSQA
jgi:hypothetical protein